MSPKRGRRAFWNVTCPGGTTAAALDVLMAADGLDPLMERAVSAATRRSRAPAPPQGATMNPNVGTSDANTTC